LLIEEGRTNLLTHSEDMTVVNGWLEDTGTGTVAWINNATTSPSGAINAEKLTEASTASARRITAKAVATAIGTTYTLSVYAKASERSILQIALASGFVTATQNFDLVNGVLGTGDATAPSIVDVGSGWYRCSIQAVSSLTSSLFGLGMVPAANSGRFASYGGVVGNGIFLWGAQLEAGSFPTSYIPTTTGTLARGADVCSITGSDFNNFYNQSEGTLLLGADEFRRGINYPTLLGISNSASAIANRIGIVSYGNKTENAIPFEFVITSGGTVQYSAFPTSTSSNFKAALAYKLDDARAALNGALAAADAPPSVLPIGANNLRIGGVGIYISSVRYYRKRLPDAKLVTLTA
jgi:hypothetical protein